MQDPPLERCGQRSTDAGADHRRGVRIGERLQVELRQGRLRLPCGLVLRPVCHQQHRSRVESARREVEHLARRVVDPVQVLDDHDDRTLRRGACDELIDGLEGAPLHYVDRCGLETGRGEGQDQAQVRKDRIIGRAVQPLGDLVERLRVGLVGREAEVAAQHAHPGRIGCAARQG